MVGVIGVIGVIGGVGVASTVGVGAASIVLIINMVGVLGIRRSLDSRAFFIPVFFREDHIGGVRFGPLARLTTYREIPCGAA